MIVNNTFHIEYHSNNRYEDDTKSCINFRKFQWDPFICPFNFNSLQSFALFISPFSVVILIVGVYHVKIFNFKNVFQIDFNHGFIPLRIEIIFFLASFFLLKKLECFLFCSSQIKMFLSFLIIIKSI